MPKGQAKQVGNPWCGCSSIFLASFQGAGRTGSPLVGLRGLELGWRYPMEILSLPSSKDEWAERVDSYLLTLSGAFSEDLGKLPREISPWTERILNMGPYGRWGIVSHLETASVRIFRACTKIVILLFSFLGPGVTNWLYHGRQWRT